MTFDLSKWVEEGSFEHRDLKLEGTIKFSHMSHPLRLTLVGSAGPLDNCSIYFWNRGEIRKMSFPIPKMARQQAGPTGRFSLGALEVVEEPDEENPGPQYRAGTLRLEWYGQNGLIQITLENPLVDFLKNDQACYAPEQLASGPGTVSDFALPELLSRIEPEGPDPRRFVSDLMQELHMIDHPGTEEKPIREHFDPAYSGGAPETQLSGAEIEVENRVLLAKLARLGICVDVCAHTGPRELYTYLSKDILEETLAISEFTPLHGLEHFPTYSVCPQCQKEMEEDYELMEKALREGKELVN